MKNKVFWLFFPAAFVIILLLAPAVVLAQPGKYDLTLSVVGAYPTTVAPGQSSHFLIELRNDGSETVNNIRLSSVPLENWMVGFQPAGLAALAAGAAKIVDVSITPGINTGSGNYNVTLLARADETESVMSVYMSIEGGSSFWPWVGLGLGVIAVGVFVFVFLRFGRH